MNKFTIKINGETVLIEAGLGKIKRLDKRLDTGVMIIPFTARQAKYGIFDIVEITYETGTNSKVVQYRVNSDNVTQISFDPILYEHYISLAEKVIKFDKYFGGSFTFTSDINALGQQVPKYTLSNCIDIISNMIPFRLVSELESGRIIKLNAALRARLDLVYASELFIEAPTAREAINEVLSVVSAISRSDENDEIIADFYNELKNVINNEKSINYISAQSSELYATTLEAHADNLVVEGNIAQSSDIYPSLGAGIGVRTEDVILSSDNGKLLLPNNMYKLISFEILAMGDITTQGGAYDYEAFEWIDMSDRVILKSIWDSLAVDSDVGYDDFTGTKIWDKGLVKQTSFYYEYYGDRIDGMFEQFGVFGDAQTIIQFMQLALYRAWQVQFPGIDPDTGIDAIDYENALTNYQSLFETAMFRIKYIPVLNKTKLRSQRRDLSNINKESQILSNQRNRLLSLEQFTNKMQGQIQQLGNDFIESTHIYASVFDVFDIGDYTYINNQLYIITELETQDYTDYVKVIYRLDKNFNRVSEFVGVDAEVRLTEITEDKRNLIKQVIYEEYVFIEASNSVPQGNKNSLLFTDLAITNFMNTFVPSATFSSTNIGVQSEAVDEKLTPFTSNGGINQLLFAWYFKDNIKLADQLIVKTAVNQKNVQNPVLQTEEDGTYANNELRLKSYKNITEVTKVKYEDDPAGYVTSKRDTIEGGRSLPLINPPNNPFIDLLIDGTFAFDKDVASISRVGLTLHVLPKKTSLNKVVVGRFFTLRNQLISNEQVANLFIYVSTLDVYNQNDNLLIKGSNTFVKPTMNVANQTVTIPAGLLTDKTSWALGDSDGNLYIGVNQLDRNTEEITVLPYLILDFENKHPEKNYNW